MEYVDIFTHIDTLDAQYQVNGGVITAGSMLDKRLHEYAEIIEE